MGDRCGSVSSEAAAVWTILLTQREDWSLLLASRTASLPWRARYFIGLWSDTARNLPITIGAISYQNVLSAVLAFLIAMGIRWIHSFPEGRSARRLVLPVMETDKLLPLANLQTGNRVLVHGYSEG